MVTYVSLFVSLLLNYLPHHLFCLDGIYVTSYSLCSHTFALLKKIKLFHWNVSSL
jgi:hypothetical protein